MWGSRSTAYYTGPKLAPASDELEAAFEIEAGLAALRWAERHFRDLTPEQQVELGRAARKIRRAAKE